MYILYVSISLIYISTYMATSIPLVVSLPSTLVFTIIPSNGARQPLGSVERSGEKSSSVRTQGNHV